MNSNKSDWQQRIDNEDTDRYTHNLLSSSAIVVSEKKISHFYSQIENISKRDYSLSVCGLFYKPLYYVKYCDVTK